MATFKANMTVDLWKRRLALIKKVQTFFEDKGVLQVDTPILSQASALDPAIDVFYADFFVDGNYAYQKTHPKRFLSTSPEFAMKRLLASGYPDVYQIAKAFRNGEAGDKHNPEFSILEWYRIAWSQKKLMDEVFELLQLFVKTPQYSTITYLEAFQKFTSIDPFKASLEVCQNFCRQNNLPIDDSFDEVNVLLDYILGAYICPQLGLDEPQFLIEWPAEQAALAQTFTDENSNEVAERFELFYQGMELCNGYHELIDAQEQESRFLDDLKTRTQLKKSLLKIDHNFISALKSGVPECSGVAVGLDRMIMLALGKSSIKEVLLFADENS